MDSQGYDKKSALTVLAMNTLAFTVCFAAWTMNGVLVTFLMDNGLFSWSKAQVGWLIGIPVLTGSILRLPIGVLTDRYGGKYTFVAVMLFSALSLYYVSFARGFSDFIVGSLGFGVAGAGFAAGIAFTSVWFPKEKQGTALGIFGTGNAGAAVTSLGAPTILKWLTDGGQQIENWRMLPRVYGAMLVIMSLFFFFMTRNKMPAASGKTLSQRLSPLKDARVWRFGLYYFYVFGGFVALSQWLIPYYTNVYAMSLATAGLVASIFSLPSGLIRALGGWLSDKFGARKIMYWVFGWCLVCTLLLIVPRMDIMSPGSGINAANMGEVTEIGADFVKVGEKVYPYKPRADVGGLSIYDQKNDVLVMPSSEFWQEPLVKVGDPVKRKQLLARGTTHIYFQANVWIFTALVFFIGIFMGFGKAAVYKYIPDYFPQDVGVVGGIVGVIGGLGGFVCPIIFGYMLDATGLWTTAWMFFSVLIVLSLWWMNRIVGRIMHAGAPALMRQVEVITK